MTMQIKEGGYYITRDGRTVGPMERTDPHSYYAATHPWLDPKTGHTFPGWSEDIIAEATDLTTIATPFGLLDEATQTALRVHGGPYERYSDDGEWKDSDFPVWYFGNVYRVKPGPKRETIVNREMYISNRGCVATNAKMPGARPVTVTFDTIDGKIDLASYRLEER